VTTGSRTDPLASFRFVVRIENMELGFSEVSGLATGPNVAGRLQGLEASRTAKRPGQAKVTTLTLKRGYTPNGHDLWNWRKSVVDGAPQRRGGTITMLDEKRKPAVVWTFSGAWPSKWTGPEMNAKSNDVAIEEMEIAAEGVTLQT
jgi:phage tail-like protein